MVPVRALTDSFGKVRGMFYGWWLAGIAALIMVIGTVPIFQGMPVWFVVLEKNFGWSSAQISLAFSLTRVEGSIMGPISGYLIDTAYLIVVGSTAHQATRAGKMVAQYPWMYERAGPLAWRRKSGTD